MSLIDYTYFPGHASEDTAMSNFIMIETATVIFEARRYNGAARRWTVKARHGLKNNVLARNVNRAEAKKVAAAFNAQFQG